MAALETGQSDLRDTDRTLLQVVDGKGERYESKFDDKLDKFSEKLQPVLTKLTSLEDSTTLKNSLTLIKWGGAFVAAVLAAVGVINHKVVVHEIQMVAQGPVVLQPAAAPLVAQ